jgi:hypothetical protein
MLNGLDSAWRGLPLACKVSSHVDGKPSGGGFYISHVGRSQLFSLFFIYRQQLLLHL